MTSRCERADSSEWSRHVDDELSLAARAELDEHLAGCADCRRTVASTRSLVRRARGMREREAPGHILVGLQAAVVARPRQKATPRTSYGTRIWFAAASMLAVASITIFAISSNRGTSRTAPSALDSAATKSIVSSVATIDRAAAEASARLALDPHDQFLISLVATTKHDREATLDHARTVIRRAR